MILEPLAVPLALVEGGQLRVAGTRIPFQMIVYAYREGASTEEILERLPTLKADDLYSLLAYYLRHKAEVDAYVLEQEHLEDQWQEKIEARFPQSGLRQKLLVRRANKS